jgi:uncharacterized protein YggE
MTRTQNKPLAILVSVVALCFATLALVCPADAAERQPSKRTLEAVGRATVRVAPDTLQVTVAIETQGDTAAEAAKENARISRRVSSALERDIGSDGEVSTSGYSLRARYEYLKAEQRQKLVGYDAANTVTVTTELLEQAGPLIDTAVAGGATAVRSINFTLRDDEAVRHRAVLEAGRRARAEVDAIADSLGVEVGALLSATTEFSAPDAPRPQFARGVMMAESAAAGTPISAGELAVEMAVHVVFEVR